MDDEFTEAFHKAKRNDSQTFPDLLIRYEDSNGVESVRKISQVEVREADYIVAFCQFRQEDRTFKVSRITSAVDLATGEEIENLYTFFGIPRPESILLPPPKPLPLTTEEMKRQRKKEKWALYREFRFEIIRDHITKKFFQLFDNRCYKCGAGSRERLVMDHHVPVARGGHFTPGNLVALCIYCNNKKADMPPESFYSRQELDQLQPLLAEQDEIFSFQFDWESWELDKAGYLLSLEIDATLVHQALHNEEHPFYIRTLSLTIT